MQITNSIRKKTKSSIIIQTIANIFSRTYTIFFKASIISNNNTLFSYLSNTLWGIITPIPWNSDIEIL